MDEQEQRDFEIETELTKSWLGELDAIYDDQFELPEWD